LIVLTPHRESYIPNDDDISILADGLLVAPGARWQDWFTRGDSHYYDFYPDYPAHEAEFTRTAFTRPAFQFVLYIAHFLLGRDWPSYLLTNCLAVAGMGAIAFQIARSVLRLSIGSSLAATIMVVVSPPLWVSLVWGLGYAIEPLTTVFVAAAFLAVFARRDFLCLGFLLLALLTKENAVWAPFAAAATVLLHPKLEESLRRRVFTAVSMLLPIVMWLGLRFAFFGGVGGTYATAGYTPFGDFLKLILFKLSHIHYLFTTDIMRQSWEGDRGMGFRILDWGMALLIYALLSLWALHILAEAIDRIRYAMGELRWRNSDGALLVALWAAIALAFHFALPLTGNRYATSVVIFAWPALIAEVERRNKGIIWLGLAMLCAVSLTRTSYRLSEWMLRAHLQSTSVPNDVRSMDAVLKQVPADVRQIYVLSTGGLPVANPEYVRLILGVPAEIIRVVEIAWSCEANDLVAFDHTIADGVMSMNITLPSCAHFYFATDRFNSELTKGGLYRNNRMNYELPEVERIKGSQPYLSLGRRMTIHISPTGPASFIIEHGKPGGIATFDIP
jgi:hypothetical protein